jgi:hypothetical protein
MIPRFIPNLPLGIRDGILPGDPAGRIVASIPAVATVSFRPLSEADP